MKYIIETNRILLREFSVEDAEDFFRLNGNPKVIKYTGNLPFQSIEEAVIFLKNYNDYSENGFGRWTVLDKENLEFLGWCGLKYDRTSNETDIGFRFLEEYWNKGFATESAKACIDFGFKELKLKSIIGRAMSENVASIQVLKKIGLKYENAFDFDGKEGVIYRIENLDFNKEL